MDNKYKNIVDDYQFKFKVNLPYHLEKYNYKISKSYFREIELKYNNNYVNLKLDIKRDPNDEKLDPEISILIRYRNEGKIIYLDNNNIMHIEVLNTLKKMGIFPPKKKIKYKDIMKRLDIIESKLSKILIPESPDKYAAYAI